MRQFIARLSILASISLLPATLLAAGVEVTGVTIDAPGIHEAILTESTGSHRKHPAAFELVRDATQVRAARGVLFGFHYTLDGAPRRTEVSIREVYRFPGEGILRGGRRVTVDETLLRRRIGEPYFTGFEFEHAGEMVSGTWTIEIWHEDRKLGEQAFTVTR